MRQVFLPLLLLLIAPAALHAQNPTKSKNQDAVICHDGTSASGNAGCESHGGVDAVTTNASRNGRVDAGPTETGHAGGATASSDSAQSHIKVDTTQSWMPDTANQSGGLDAPSAVPDSALSAASYRAASRSNRGLPRSRANVGSIRSQAGDT